MLGERGRYPHVAMLSLKFTLRRLLVAIAIFSVLIGIARNEYRDVVDRVMHTYASRGCGDLLVDFMKRNGNSWPQDWIELENFYNQSGRRYVGVNDFSDLKDNFEIDFSVHPQKVDFQHGGEYSEFPFVRYRHSSQAVNCESANVIVLEYMHDTRNDETYSG